MNLVSFSLHTKGPRNFVRRLRTVFTRFGFSEQRIRRSLLSLLQALQVYQAAPTFFIPAVVLNRHPQLISEIARLGAEIGIHGCVHNDYRTLSQDDQYLQTQLATEIFASRSIDYAGFRNPYLGWNEETLEVFRRLGFGYESNEAVLHEVVNPEDFPCSLRDSFARSQELFQALPCSAYTVRPHFEHELLRIPTSIPDDEILFDRLHITDPQEVGRIWCEVMRRVLEHEGVYTLNLHPERGVLCKSALESLLNFAYSQPIWIARLHEIAAWWRERSTFRFAFTPLAEHCWQVQAACSEQTTILGRYLELENASVQTWSGCERVLANRDFVVRAERLPCIALSQRTPSEVKAFLYEQGYAVCADQGGYGANDFACYLDFPAGLGRNRVEHMYVCDELIQTVEALEAPLLRFGPWPGSQRAALVISGDIDSVTIQDFFLRILEVY